MINECLQCDFCSVPGPVWRYPARSFVAYCAPNVAGESVGDWAACDLCHVLIEADDRSGQWRSTATDRDRVDYAFNLCLNRPPTAAERDEIMSLYQSQHKRLADGWISSRAIATGRLERTRARIAKEIHQKLRAIARLAWQKFFY